MTSGQLRLFYRFIIPVIIMIITEREICRQLLREYASPVCREVHIVVSVLLVIVKSETVMAVIAVYI